MEDLREGREEVRGGRGGRGGVGSMAGRVEGRGRGKWRSGGGEM